MTTTDTNVNNLIINTMTKATYDTITPSATELYMVTDDPLSSNDVINALGYTPQTQLVSGTNIKTINNTSLLGSGNIDTSEIFVATYGTTSYSDVLTAYNAGKTIICKNGEFIGYLYDYMASIFYFYTFSKSSSLYSNCTIYHLSFTNSWGTDRNYELASADLYNVSSINSNSAVATALNGKADTDLINFSSTGKTVLDGQWVESSQSIFSSQSLTSSTDADLPKTVNLPNDGHIYEVAFRGNVTTGASSGNNIAIIFYGNVLNAHYYLCGTQTRSNSSVGTRGFVSMPMKYGTDNLNVIRRSTYTGTAALTAIAYRRIGTNT